MTRQTRDYKSYELEQEPRRNQREHRIGEIIGSSWNVNGEPCREDRHERVPRKHRKAIQGKATSVSRTFKLTPHFRASNLNRVCTTFWHSSESNQSAFRTSDDPCATEPVLPLPRVIPLRVIIQNKGTEADPNSSIRSIHFNISQTDLRCRMLSLFCVTCSAQRGWYLTCVS